MVGNGTRPALLDAVPAGRLGTGTDVGRFPFPSFIPAGPTGGGADARTKNWLWYPMALPSRRGVGVVGTRSSSSENTMREVGWGMGESGVEVRRTKGEAGRDDEWPRRWELDFVERGLGLLLLLDLFWAVGVEEWERRKMSLGMAETRLWWWW